MDTMTAVEQPALWVETMPDLPGIVHGIKSLHPCIVQCDGCAKTVEGDHLGYTVLTSGIFFNPRLNDGRRLCRDCWKADGWVDDNLRGWKRVNS